MHLLRLVLLLDVLAAALAGAAVLVGIGVPLAAAGRIGPGAVGLMAAATAIAVLGVGTILLLRSVARPVDRLLAAAERLGATSGSLPLLSPPGERETASLGRAAIAFERVATALQEERGRLAAKVEELERANLDLAQARESWIRSERLAALGRLASGIAHEVGNPLGAISGFAELARGRLGPGLPEVEDLLRRIAGEAARIDRLVRDMLDFGRPAEPVCLPIAVRPAVESALRLAGVQPRFRDVEAVVELPADLPPVVADEGRLAQVFLNLFLNAGDAMGGTGPDPGRGVPPGRARPGAGGGRGAGDPGGAPDAHLRPLLHDQGARNRDRARPGGQPPPDGGHGRARSRPSTRPPGGRCSGSGSRPRPRRPPRSTGRGLTPARARLRPWA